MTDRDPGSVEPAAGLGSVPSIAASAVVSLSQADRAILALEGPTIAGHTCKVIRLGPPALSVAGLVATVAARLARAPSLTWRLAGPVEAPYWEPDPTFDLHAHIGSAASERADSDRGVGAIPGVVDERELRREVARLFAQRLDRDRPLWRMDLIGPLADGDSVIVWKVHHAFADGSTLMRLAQDVLWDPLPDHEPPHARPTSGAASWRHHHAEVIWRELFPGLRPSPFDARIGYQRAVAFASTSLSGLHDAAHSLAAATVNDAVLAVLAGALRRWLEHRHGPLRDVRVKVPVSLHHGDRPQGNDDSYFCVPLPVGEPDLRRRLTAIQAGTALRKTQHDAQELDELLARLGRAGPGLRRWAQRLETSPRTFALNISNVRGPRLPVAVGGIPVRSLHSLVELAPRHALRVAVVSLADTLCFGLLADPDVIDDLAVLASAVEQEATALTTAR
jgi:diacylglycerol O-acyltransferase